MTVFERIKKLSKNRGWSLQTLATKSGLGVNSIYKWKNQTPKLDKLAKVARTLNVTVDELLNDDIGQTDTSSDINKMDLDVEEAINSMRSYRGEEISESQREVLRGIIKGYLDNQGK